ncbi:MAG: VWA domain-containing protein [Sphingobacteriales bacterium]|nr:VWA domain-containing protein [Sphingobacteriales bacterium]
MVIIWHSSATAQIWSVERYEGIGNTAVHSLLFDQQNNLWIGTQDSACILRNGSDSLETILHTGVYSINEDPRHTVWLGLTNNMLYNSETQDTYPLNLKNSNVLNSILFENNYLYLGTPEGMYEVYYRQEDDEIVNMLPQKMEDIKYVNVIYKDQHGIAGDKWVGTDNGLFHYKQKKLSPLIPGTQVTAIATNNEKIWAVTNNGIVSVDKQLQVRKVPLCRDFFDYRVEDVAFDSEGSLWIAGKTLAVMDKTGYCRPFTEEDGFFSKHPLCIATDNKKNVWVGTEGKGLYKIYRRDEDSTLMARYEYMNNCAFTNLVVLMDISSSMNAEHRLPKLKKNLSEVLQRMRPEDKVTLITFASTTRLLLPTTSCHKNTLIESALSRTGIGGKSDIVTGLAQSLRLLSESYITDGNNCLIIATDGEFEIKEQLYDLLKSMPEQQPFTISVFDFGNEEAENKDLAKLAQKAGGTYTKFGKKNDNSLVQKLADEIKRVRTAPAVSK